MGKLLSLLNMKVLGGVLAASLLANIFLFWGYTHQVEKKVECTQAVKTVNKVATEKKIIIEKRQDNVNNKTEVALRAELARIRSSLHDSESRVVDLPRTTDTTGHVDEHPSESPLLLPEDKLICSINTALAAAWPVWYQEQVKIRKEENVNSEPDTKGDSIPSE